MIWLRRPIAIAMLLCGALMIGGPDAAAQESCTLEQLAGVYEGDYGPIDCRPEGDKLRCCYYGAACSGEFELALDAAANRLVGTWREGTTTGPVEFGIDNACSLASGLWAYEGQDPSRAWTISARAAVAEPEAAAPADDVADVSPSAAAGDSNETGGSDDLADAGAACTLDQLAGDYETRYGPMTCQPEASQLRCCYGGNCSNDMELELDASANKLVGTWREGGSTGPIVFGIDNSCSIASGLWAYAGNEPSGNWQVTPRVAGAELLDGSLTDDGSQDVGDMADQQSTFSIFDDINPLAPEGLAVGMPLSETHDLLVNRGFDGETPEALYRRERGYTNTVLRLRRDFNTQGLMPPNGALGEIIYNAYTLELGATIEQVVERFSQIIGAQPYCFGLRPTYANCHWEQPPNEPFLREIELEIDVRPVQIAGKSGEGNYVTLKLIGATDLAQLLTADQESGFASITDLDLIAPEGIAIGMAIWEVKPHLDARGYGAFSCTSATDMYGGTVNTRVDNQGDGECVAAKPVASLIFEARDMYFADSALDLLARAEEQLGGEPNCKTRSDDYVECYWERPPGAPLVQTYMLYVWETGFDIVQIAVPDLDTHVSPPPPPVDTRPAKWWVAALEEQEARGMEPLALEQEVADLSLAGRGKALGDARRVRGYCDEQDLFSTLHDCYCVAQHVLEERAAAYAILAESQPQPEDATLYQIANTLASNCISKPGAASYAYEQCMQTYAGQLEHDTDAYCTCYADEFANRFEEFPLAEFNTLAGHGTASLLACDERFTPHPSQ